MRRRINLRASTLARLRAAASCVGVDIDAIGDQMIDPRVSRVDVSTAQLARAAAEAEDLLGQEEEP